MFPIGESLAIRNLEPAVSAGRERPAGEERPAGDGGLHAAVRRSPIADQNAFQSGVRLSRVGTLEPAVSAGNGFLRAGNDPPGTAVSRQKHGGCL